MISYRTDSKHERISQHGKQQVSNPACLHSSSQQMVSTENQSQTRVVAA